MLIVDLPTTSLSNDRVSIESTVSAASPLSVSAGNLSTISSDGLISAHGHFIEEIRIISRQDVFTTYFASWRRSEPEVARDDEDDESSSVTASAYGGSR